MTLRLQILDGVVAKSTELIGKMENYVSVTVLNDPRNEGREVKTKIVQGSARTKKEENRINFNDVLEVPVSSQNARLLVKIMDEDMTSDDTCCEGYVNLNPCGCLSGSPNNYRLQMYLPAKKGQQPQAGSGGELRFVAQYY